MCQETQESGRETLRVKHHVRLYDNFKFKQKKRTFTECSLRASQCSLRALIYILAEAWGLCEHHDLRKVS